MTKLHEVIAVQAGRRSKAAADAGQWQRQLTVPDLLSGLSRTYEPQDDEGEQRPPEIKLVQVKAEDALLRIAGALTQAYDVTATVDWTNTRARADVVVGEVTILADVPVTFLLFLEKQLTELAAFIRRLPVLDPGENWSPDAATATQRSESVRKASTRKELRNHVMHAATDKHPAQVITYNEDVTVGWWTTTKYSGALPAARRDQINERVSALLDAVKVARQHANDITADQQHVGSAVFDYLLVG